MVTARRRGLVGDRARLILDGGELEVAWAGEARWFVQFLRPAAGSEVEFRVQISPDGINWVDHEDHAPLVSEAVGIRSIPVQNFGHWLRLRTEQLSGTDSPMLRIYLELKE